MKIKKKLLKEIFREVLYEKARWKDEDWEKQSDKEKWREYIESGDYFVHFSSVGPDNHGGFSVGINPFYSYSTPLGIYAYPLDKTFEDKLSRFKSFAAERRWAYILKPEQIDKKVIIMDDDGSNFSEIEYKEAMSKIKGTHAEITGKDDTYRIDKEMSMLARRAGGRGGYFGKLYRVMEGIADEWAKQRDKKKSHLMSSFFRKELDIGVIVDKGAGIIFSAQSYQAVFFRRKYFDVVDVLDNEKLGYYEEESEEYTKTGTAWDKV